MSERDAPVDLIAPIVTRVAQMGDGEHEFMGSRLFAELLGKQTLTGLFALSLGARRLGADDVRILEAIGVAVTLADPRIWRLKLTRLVASHGGLLQGYAAGLLVLENDLIGPWSMHRGAQTFVDLMRAVGGDAGVDDPVRVAAAVEAELTTTRRMPGFGVPFRETDERMDALAALLRGSERLERPYWRLMLTIERHLLQSRRTRPNINAAVMALLLDMGFEPAQTGWMLILLLQVNFAAIAYESATAPNADLQRLPLSCFRYAGAARRSSPRAANARKEDHE